MEDTSNSTANEVQTPDNKTKLRKIWEDILSYFNVKYDLEPQGDIETSIRSGVSFKGSQLLTLIFAIFIAWPQYRQHSCHHWRDVDISADGSYHRNGPWHCGAGF